MIGMLMYAYACTAQLDDYDYDKPDGGPLLLAATMTCVFFSGVLGHAR